MTGDYINDSYSRLYLRMVCDMKRKMNDSGGG